MAENSYKIFKKHVENALKHFHDPKWLGETSPLSSPYFLGEHYSGNDRNVADSTIARGHVLQSVLRDAIEKMSGRGEDQVREYHDILNIEYLQDTNFNAEARADKVGMSRAKFYRKRLDALEYFASEILIQYLKPTLRLESPKTSGSIFGRNQLLAECMIDIDQSKTIGLTGPSGVGKTTFGVYLAQESERPTFWYTIRPSINDNLKSYLFSLGAFMHKQGASGLWLQLQWLTDEKQLDAEAALAAARHDLAQLDIKPLLCINKADSLLDTNVDVSNSGRMKAHEQIQAFLQGLHGYTPLLLIGSQTPADVDRVYQVSGLDIGALEELLTSHDNIMLTSGEAYLLWKYSQGYPRIVELFMEIHRAGESFETIIQQLEEDPSTEVLLNRLLRHLSPVERAILQQLSVYQSSVPDDFWQVAMRPSDPDEVLSDEIWAALQEGNQALEQLRTRRIIQQDSHGGIALLPAYQTSLYRQLSAEQRTTFHHQAAKVRIHYLQFTRATYHYIQAEEAQSAIQLWHRWAQIEINHGQGDIALALFRTIDLERLGAKEQQILTAMQARLESLTGNYQAAIDTLDAISFDTPVIAIEAYELKARAANFINDFDLADEANESGLALSESLLGNKLAYFHKNRAWSHERRKNIDMAWQESQLARFEVENIQGIIERDRGNHSNAENCFLTALALAEKLGHTEGIAKTALNLGYIWMDRGDVDRAEQYFEQANHCFKQVGDINGLVGSMATQANMYNIAGRPADAITSAIEVYGFLSHLNNRWIKAVTDTALTEAYLALGDLNEAEKYAQLMITSDEPEIIADGMRSLGEIKMAQGRLTQAEEFIQKSIEMSVQHQDPYLEAYAWRAMGNVHNAAHHEDASLAAFEKAIALFSQMDLQNEIDKTQALLDGMGK